MLANYLQDQLQADFAREELVKEGKLTAKKADEQQEEWEQVSEIVLRFRVGNLPMGGGMGR
jgi:uncharacterized protein YrzB (UPF0473 family)